MNYDLIIIGSGPAGYVAAIRAGQTGLKTLIIDKKYIGGMCLNWGCIPTKSLMESGKVFRQVKQAAEYGVKGIDPEKLEFDWNTAISRTHGIVSKLSRGIEYLWKKNGVEYLKAEAKILSATQVKAGNAIYEAPNILIATGSRIIPQKLFASSVEIEDIYEMPCTALKPLIYGRGSYAIELAQFFAMIDKRPSILAESLPLMPSLDSHLESFLKRKLKKDGIPIIPLEEASIKSGNLYHKDKEIEYDVVINAGFREAVLPPMDIDLEIKNGYIATDDSFETSVKGIYAAGDVNGKGYLAHAASAQAMEVIAAIHGKLPEDGKRLIPLNIYTDPEIAQIGITEDALKAQGAEYEVKQISLNSNGKAIIEGDTEGFIRLIYEPKYHEVLGVQIVAANATDLISEAGVLMELEGTTFDLARTIHAHPTVSEIYMDAGVE
ncbi:MAG: FAD-dependent oxidoreductase [Candidatus Cloacimonetes bacterium]|nr:FAD-dependent oxidoreductase [Candidatus Cloacimonadota bacterium]